MAEEVADSDEDEEEEGSKEAELVIYGFKTVENFEKMF